MERIAIPYKGDELTGYYKSQLIKLFERKIFNHKTLASKGVTNDSDPTSWGKYEGYIAVEYNVDTITLEFTATLFFDTMTVEFERVEIEGANTEAEDWVGPEPDSQEEAELFEIEQLFGRPGDKNKITKANNNSGWKSGDVWKIGNVWQSMKFEPMYLIMKILMDGEVYTDFATMMREVVGEY